MAKTKYHIVLSDEQKDMLNKIIDEGTESDRTILRARILLESDQVTGSKLSVSKLADKLGTTNTTIQSTRTAFGNGGLEAAVFRKKRTIRPVRHRITDVMEKQILELAQTPPPDGRTRWTFELLREQTIKIGIVEQISQTSLRNIIHRNNRELK